MGRKFSFTERFVSLPSGGTAPVQACLYNTTRFYLAIYCCPLITEVGISTNPNVTYNTSAAIGATEGNGLPFELWLDRHKELVWQSWYVVPPTMASFNDGVIVIEGFELLTPDESTYQTASPGTVTGGLATDGDIPDQITPLIQRLAATRSKLLL